MSAQSFYGEPCVLNMASMIPEDPVSPPERCISKIRGTLLVTCPATILYADCKCLTVFLSKQRTKRTPPPEDLNSCVPGGEFGVILFHAESLPKSSCRA